MVKVSAQCLIRLENPVLVNITTLLGKRNNMICSVGQVTENE